MRAWLLDTGPLVAYLDATDPEHRRTADALDAFTGQLVTTSAVVTEAMHFLAPHPRGPETLAEFAAESGLTIADLSDAEALRDAARRMQKYGDLPMDFADATLVILGERLGLFDVATLDRRGFTVYRTSRGRRFNLVLERR